MANDLTHVEGGVSEDAISEIERCWGLGDEKNYLKRLSVGEDLASCCLSVYVKPVERLRAYLVAAENRNNWGEIDPAKAVAYAHELIWQLTH